MRLPQRVRVVGTVLAVSAALAGSSLVSAEEPAYVDALIVRAASEPAEKALLTLMEAEDAARPDAAALRSVGIAFSSLGGRMAAANRPLAEKSYARAVALLENAAPDTLNLADARAGLGNLMTIRQATNEARPHLEAALAIRERLDPKGLGMVFALNSLGANRLIAGNSDAARRLHRRALIILQDHPRESSRRERTLQQLSQALLDQGYFAMARDHLQQALELAPAGAAGDWSRAATRGLLGRAATGMGLLREGEAHYQACLEIRKRQSPQSLDVAFCLNGLAWVSLSAGDAVRAKARYLEALAMQRAIAPNSPRLAHTLGALARIAVLAKEYEETDRLLREAIGIAGQPAASRLVLSELLQSQGANLLRLSRPKEARSALERAVAVLSEQSGDTILMAEARAWLGRACDEAGDPAEAIRQYREAIRLFRAHQPGGSNEIGALRRLGTLMLEAERPEERREAAGLLQRAAALEDRLRSFSSTPEAHTGEPEAPALPERRARPEVRILSPNEDSPVAGNEAELTLAFVSAAPVQRYRVWINGREFGGARGFELPTLDEKGRLLDRGRILDRGSSFGAGQVAERGQILDKGRILDRDGDRSEVIASLPAALREPASRPEQAQVVIVRHRIPLERTDGDTVIIGVEAMTADRVAGPRQVIRLRRPAAADLRGTLRVLTIGVGAYSGLPPLRYAAADARAMAQVFRTQASAAPLYRSVDVRSLTDAEATPAAIRSAISELAGKVEPGDSAVVTFSGHGIRSGDAFYFAPAGFNPVRPAETGLPWGEVLSALAAVRNRARSIWLLADCCRAAPELRDRAGTPDQLTAGVEPGNLMVVTASSGDAPSYESAELQHGLFTRAWVDALMGKAPEVVYENTPAGRVLTLAGLQFAVDLRVRQLARQQGVRQAVEFPRLQGSFAPGQPVFSVGGG